MTALKKYQKLECPGLWRPTPEAQRRDVSVKFGESTLVLTDPRSDLALTHWSLPAVERLNPGQLPAIYGPGADAEETLELDERDMIAALDTVRGALEAALPHPGRLRNRVALGLTVSVVLLAVFWMPGALVSHTVSVVPPATRAAIGQMALADLTRLTGAPCADPFGQRALATLAGRVLGPDPGAVLILRDGLAGPLHLPDRQILLPEALVAAQDGPEPLAGFLLAERARAEADDPLIPLLQHAGSTATFRLLTTGVLPESAVAGYAEVLLQSEPASLADDDLLTRFATADISSTPYAYALDPTGETVLSLIEGDPFRAGSPRPVLADGDWVSLQGICAE